MTFELPDGWANNAEMIVSASCSTSAISMATPRGCSMAGLRSGPTATIQSDASTVSMRLASPGGQASRPKGYEGPERRTDEGVAGPTPAGAAQQELHQSVRALGPDPGACTSLAGANVGPPSQLSRPAATAPTSLQSTHILRPLAGPYLAPELTIARYVLSRVTMFSIVSI